jgi:hypothetical protein
VLYIGVERLAPTISSGVSALAYIVIQPLQATPNALFFELPIPSNLEVISMPLHNEFDGPFVSLTFYSFPHASEKSFILYLSQEPMLYATNNNTLRNSVSNKDFSF